MAQNKDIKPRNKRYKFLYNIALLILVLIALYATLGQLFVSKVEGYKEQLTKTLSEALHAPVTIGRIVGGWSIVSPTITVYDIYIGDEEKNLQAEQLVIELDVPQSLLSREIKVTSIWAEKMQLQVRQDEQGLWGVGGIPRQKDPITVPIILTELQRFAKISLYDTQITVYPYKEQSHTFHRVNATLNQLGTNTSLLEGTLYLADDKMLTLSLNATIEPNNWQQLSAKLYIDIPAVNWAKKLPKALNKSPWKFKQLTLGAEIWATINKGQPSSITVNSKDNQLAVQHEKKKAVSFDKLAFQAWFNQDQKQAQLQVNNLSFTMDKTPFDNLNVLVTKTTDNDNVFWQLKTNILNVTKLINPVQRLAPIPIQVNEIISAVNPKGVLRNIELNWDPQQPPLEQLSFAANIDNASFSPYKDTVGASSITGSIEGKISEGHLKLNTKKFSLFIAKVFPKAWNYHWAKAQLNWSFDGDTVSLHSPLMQLKGDEGDLVGDMMIRLHPKEEIKDYMDLRANISKGDGSYTPKYLPTKIDEIDPDLIKWLTTAIKSGHINNGFFHYQGSLNKETPPNAHELLLYMDVEDAQVDYQPNEWPAISKTTGKVFVESSAVRVLASKGIVSESEVSNVYINIPHVSKDQVTHLYLTGNVSGTMKDTLTVLKAAPTAISTVFKDWQGSGNLTGKLTLDVPLKKHVEPLVIVDFSTKNGSLNIKHPIPELTHIVGDFQFNSQSGLSAKKITARAFGLPLQGVISATGKSGKAASKIKASGNVEVSKLASWLTQQNRPWPLTGIAPYSLEIDLTQNKDTLTITSSTKGVGINLPAPFAKKTEETKELLWKMSFGDDLPTHFELNYEELISGLAVMQPDKPQTMRGELRINSGKAKLSDKAGLQVIANLTTVNLEDWKKVIAEQLPAKPTKKSSLLDLRFLRNIDLRIGKAKGFGLPEQQMAAYLQTTSKSGWRLDIDSQTVKGRLTSPEMADLPFYINLQHLKLPQNNQSMDLSKDALEKLNLNDIPSVDITIRRLYSGNDALGTVRLRHTSSQQGIELSNLSLNLRGLNIEGNLKWRIGQQTNFTGRLSGKDLGVVLKNWGFDQSVTSKSFQLDIDGYWPGSPLALESQTFTGKLEPRLKSGRLVTLDSNKTNALRIFGILNLDAVQRRLRLDFSDLYAPGLTYDEIKGKFNVVDGVFHTEKPMEFTGPSMNLSMTGKIDMRTQKIDAILKAGVPIGSNVSIAALAIAPPIGGAMLIVDHFLGDKLMKFVAITYSIKGDWNDPEISLGSN